MHSSRSLKLTTTFKWLLAAGMVSTLVACGGDGGSDPVTPPPVPKTTLTLVGTAATGLAISGGPVSVTCRVGTGTATTAADGAYTVVAASATADAVGPCVLTVNTAAGATLRSFATGTGDSGKRANITPLTELLVSYVATQTGAGAASAPAALVANTTLQNTVSNQNLLNASVTNLIDVIKKTAGSDVNIPTDFLNKPMTAATATNPNAGDALDKVLDTLKARAVITATGAPSTAVAQAAVQNAAQHTVTGATGGG